MSNKGIDKYITKGVEGGMFSIQPRGSSVKDKILPHSLREGLRKQWTTSAGGSSNVLLRYVDQNSGKDWFVTGWDGYETLAGYTEGGFKNVSLSEIVNSGAVIDTSWNQSLTLSEVKILRPMSEMGASDRTFKGYKNKSFELFTQLTRGGSLQEDVNGVEESEDDSDCAVSVLYHEDHVLGDAAVAVNIMENREDQLFEGTPGIEITYAFGYHDGEWQIEEIVPGDTIHANEFILQVSEETCDEGKAPTDEDLFTLAESLPAPLIEGVRHAPEVQEQYDWIVATGSSLLESGTRAYLASDGVPHGMMAVARVRAATKEEAIDRVGYLLNNSQTTEKTNSLSPFLKAASGLKIIDTD